MAINKIVNKSTLTKAAMRNAIEYILQDKKITDRLVYMTGPAPDQITWDSVYNAFLEEKKIWHKDSGRMYSHQILSFHQDEKITPEEVLEFAKEYVDKWFPGFQSIISVHQDRDHIHAHIITNTVSYVDGHKLHNSRADLQKMKDFTNDMCRERGLSVAEKGKHFDGTEIEVGETIAWSKDKYQLLKDSGKKSYVVDCGIAVMEAREQCASQEEFIREMEERGWRTTWTGKKKHITFENENGEKVRDSNLSQTFSMDISKEGLLHEFERQSEIRAKLKAERDRAEERRQSEYLDRYYSEVDAAINGGIVTETVGGTADSDRAERPAAVRGEAGGSGEDIGSFIANIDAAEQNIRDAVKASVRSVETDEAKSITTEEQRRTAEQRRNLEQKRARRMSERGR